MFQAFGWVEGASYLDYGLHPRLIMSLRTLNLTKGMHILVALV